MTVEQRFRIGDTVEVVPNYRHADWQNVPLWISGAELNALNEVNYHVAEHWPPQGRGDITDGFSEADLMPRLLSSEAPSCSRDGAGAAHSQREMSSKPDLQGELLAAAKALEPYLDAIVCYASSMDEHEPNRLAFNLRSAISQAESQEAVPPGDGG